MTNQFEQAFKIDDALYIKSCLERSKRFDYWTKRVREAREWKLTDYPHSTQPIKIIKTEKNIFIKKLLKSLLP